MSIVVFSLAQAVAPQVGSRSKESEPPATAKKQVDAETAQRLYRIATPLLRAMEHSLKPQQVSVGVIADAAINIANGGGGKLFVTTGLLERANDDQLRGLMVHEIAHEDLGHVTKLKISASGANMVLLEHLAATHTALTLIDGPMITASFSVSEELAADRQSVAILERAGYPKSVVTEALTWISKISPSHGGFISTHPNISERIKNLKASP